MMETPDAPDGSHYWTLSLGREYEVLGVENDSLRILDDRGEPVLFDPACFRVVDASEPECWVSSIEDDARYAYPPEWGRPGFFGDWHDGVAEVRRTFADQLAKWFPHAAHHATREVSTRVAK